MSKKILVYEMSDTRFEALKKTLRPLGVSVYKVAKSQYGDLIGELALGKAGQKAVGTVRSHTNIPGAAPIPAVGMPCIGEMLIFSGISGQEMDAVLAALRQADLVVPLKATVTMYNYSWNGYAIYQELSKEHRKFTK